jgi:2-polyprenyl-3-methyl-5-hydroxy-6-metoxy-1,4-benzoquinol methylase
MNINEAYAVLSASSAPSLQALNEAITAIREDALNTFIASQFTGGNVDEVEVDVQQDVLGRLFERIRQQWTAVGEREPYVSVLADEKYSLSTISENLTEFRESGAMGIRQLQQLAKKNGVQIQYGTCMELGCGVGRLTAHLAQNFQNMIGVDISPANMGVCRAYMQELGLKNTDLRLMKEITELEAIGEFDAFVSFIVIQHNPPPIQKYILDTLLEKLRPGAVFLFQTIVNSPGYVYSAEGNFRYKEGLDYEMHCLPMQHIIQTIAKHQLTLLDVLKDRQGGWGIDSVTFFGVKPT